MQQSHLISYKQPFNEAISFSLLPPTQSELSTDSRGKILLDTQTKPLHDSVTQLLQICQLHIHDASLPFPPHSKGFLLDWDHLEII